MIEQETLKADEALSKVKNNFTVFEEKSILQFIDVFECMPEGTFFYSETCITKKLNPLLSQLQKNKDYLIDKNYLIALILVLMRRIEINTIHSIRLKWILEQIGIKNKFSQEYLEQIEKEMRERKNKYQFNIEEIPDKSIIMLIIRDKKNINEEIKIMPTTRKNLLSPSKEDPKKNKAIGIWLFVVLKEYNLMENITKQMKGQIAKNIKWHHYELKQRNLWVLYLEKGSGKIENGYNKIKNERIDSRYVISDHAKFSNKIKIKQHLRQKLQQIYENLLPLPGKVDGDRIVYSFENTRQIVEEKFESFANLCFEILQAQKSLQGIFLSD